MKKLVLFFVVFMLASILFNSCEREEMYESAVVYTNDPPREIWASTENYLHTYRGYVTSNDYMVENKGYRSQPYVNPRGELVLITTGNWYLLKVHKYWGIYKGRIYVSAGYEMAAIFGPLLLDVEDQIDRTGSTIVFLDTYSNPLGTTYVISGVYN